MHRQADFRPAPVFDAMGENGWRVYLAAIAVSFIVLIEPAPTDILFVLAVGFICFSRPLPGRFLSGGALTGIILFVLFSILSFVFVVNSPARAFLALGTDFYMIAIFALTAYFLHHRGDRGFAIVMLALTAGAVVASLIALAAVLDLLQADFLWRDRHRIRVKATFKDPNVFGPFLVPSILFSAWIALVSQRFRILALGVFSLMLFALIVTYSRGAWVHAVISLAAISVMFLVHRRTANPALMGLVLILLGLFSFLMFFAEEVVASLEDSFFSKRLSLQGYDDSRFSNLADSVQQIFNNPLGIGPTQARFKFGYWPHNAFISTALHNGLPATLGLVLIYFASLFRCTGKVLAQRPGWTKYAFILAILIGLAVLMQVIGANRWRHLYLICGMAFGVYTSDRILPGIDMPVLRKHLRPTRMSVYKAES